MRFMYICVNVSCQELICNPKWKRETGQNCIKREKHLHVKTWKGETLVSYVMKIVGEN